MTKKGVTFQEAIDIVKEKVGLEGLLCQLAEEASELAHAALKLRRAIIPGNPTPVSRKEAEASLQEETADVILSLIILGLLDDEDGITHIQAKKMKRWLGRIGGLEDGK